MVYFVIKRLHAGEQGNVDLLVVVGIVLWGGVHHHLDHVVIESFIEFLVLPFFVQQHPLGANVFRNLLIVIGQLHVGEEIRQPLHRHSRGFGRIRKKRGATVRLRLRLRLRRILACLVVQGGH